MNIRAATSRYHSLFSSVLGKDWEFVFKDDKYLLCYKIRTFSLYSGCNGIFPKDSFVSKL